MTVVTRTNTPIALRTLLRRLIDRLEAPPLRLDVAPAPWPGFIAPTVSPLLPPQVLVEALQRLRDALGLPEEPTSPPRCASTIATDLVLLYTPRPTNVVGSVPLISLCARFDTGIWHSPRPSHTGNGSLAPNLRSRT